MPKDPTQSVYQRIDKFHSHLGICSQCRNHPFGLCPTGARLLKEAATGKEIKECPIVDTQLKTLPVSDEDAKELCKMGQGADCCIWLCIGTEGFECLYSRKEAGTTLLGETLKERWEKGLTVAKRNGCDRMKTLFGKETTNG